MLSGLIKSAADANSRNFDSIFHEAPELKSKLKKDANDSADAINEFLRILNKEFIKANRIELNAKNISSSPQTPLTRSLKPTMQQRRNLIDCLRQG